MSVSFRFLRRIAMASSALLLVALTEPAVAEGQVTRDTVQAPAKPSGQQLGQPNPQMMQQQFETMAPMMERMTQAMMEGSLTVLAKPETADRIATFTKNYFDALIRKGFMREDAMKIVMAHGIPALPTSR